jgi:hypothetical protein
MKFDDLLGFHGVVLRTGRLEEDARRFQQALGVRVLRRSAGSITLGLGPEFFLELRRARRGENGVLEEVHVAVRRLARRGLAPDALGGMSARRAIGEETTLIVREFVGPAAKGWLSSRRRR